jgi:hypothetical protein
MATGIPTMKTDEFEAVPIMWFDDSPSSLFAHEMFKIWLRREQIGARARKINQRYREKHERKT